MPLSLGFTSLISRTNSDQPPDTTALYLGLRVFVMLFSASNWGIGREWRNHETCKTYIEILSFQIRFRLTDLSPIFWIVQTNKAFSPWIAVTLVGDRSSSILVVVAARNMDICRAKSTWCLLLVHLFCVSPNLIIPWIHMYRIWRNWTDIWHFQNIQISIFCLITSCWFSLQG